MAYRVASPMAPTITSKEEDARLAEEVAAKSGPVETWVAYRPTGRFNPQRETRLTIYEHGLYLSKPLVEALISAADASASCSMRVSVEVLASRGLLRIRPVQDSGIRLARNGRGGGHVGSQRLTRWLTAQGVKLGRYVAECRERERAIYVDLTSPIE